MATFLHPITETELKDAYYVDVRQLGAQLKTLDNGRTTLNPQLIGSGASGPKLVYFVALYAAAAEAILDKPLERWLCENKSLESNPGEKAKVAFRVNFFLREKFQRGGLARQILPREENVFGRWGAKEVQTLAMYDGRWVWTRPEFGYQITEFQMSSMQQQYRDWQRYTNNGSIVRAKSLGDFPKKFLLSEINSLKLFKRIA